jgi:hypothetical protein
LGSKKTARARQDAPGESLDSERERLKTREKILDRKKRMLARDS